MSGIFVYGSIEQRGEGYPILDIGGSDSLCFIDAAAVMEDGEEDGVQIGGPAIDDMEAAVELIQHFLPAVGEAVLHISAEYVNEPVLMYACIAADPLDIINPVLACVSGAQVIIPSGHIIFDGVVHFLIDDIAVLIEEEDGKTVRGLPIGDLRDDIYVAEGGILTNGEGSGEGGKEFPVIIPLAIRGDAGNGRGQAVIILIKLEYI